VGLDVTRHFVGGRLMALRGAACRHCKGVKFHLAHSAKHVSEIEHFEEARASA